LAIETIEYGQGDVIEEIDGAEEAASFDGCHVHLHIKVRPERNGSPKNIYLDTGTDRSLIGRQFLEQFRQSSGSPRASAVRCLH
jgi:hypothetical protein